MSLSMTSKKITQELTKNIEVISSRADREGTFRAVKVESGNVPIQGQNSGHLTCLDQSGAFVKLVDTAASSELSCAMDCLKTPACFTFRMENGVCSLGGYDWL